MSDSTLKPPAVSSSSLQLPSITMSAPITKPQQLNPTSSSSATGNPRNKCALKPGYSLMNWVRLCNSGSDLSGTGGRIVPVSNEELARHNMVDDAWMAIRGKVFNVTRYMDFHPGGVDELMRGVGRDATMLFDEVHAWVNYPQLLGKCYIGPLQYTAKTDDSLRKKLLNNQQELSKPSTKPAELVPRFDWIQQRSELTLYFYTRQFANPGLLIKYKTPLLLEICVQLEHNWHIYDFELLGDINWPPKAVRAGAETGKIEVLLTKREATAWTNYGTHKVRKLADMIAQEERYDFEVLRREGFNHDSFELSLKNQKLLILPPVGFHVAIQMPLEDEVLQRSYTPVSHNFLPANSSSRTALENCSTLHFLIKSYPHGKLTSKLQKLAAGDTVQLSLPRGNFCLQSLARHRNILLLAAGSGLTPILSMLQPLLKRNTNRIERLHLLFFNKTQADIWLEDCLQSLQNSDERFSHEHLLSRTNQGQSKHISVDILTPLLQTKTAAELFTYIAICGPNVFNAAALKILKQLNFKMDNVHVFQG